MAITAQYLDPDHSVFSRSDMPGAQIPARAGEPLYDELAAAAIDITAYQRPPLAAVDVERERDRRLAIGFDYDFGDARGVHHIGTDPKDMQAWMFEVTPWATARVHKGNPNATLDIKTNTGPATITASEWLDILIAAEAARQPIWQGYFWLKAQDPIPADYASNEAYWSGA